METSKSLEKLEIKPSQVLNFQGFDYTFTIPESLLQKIWAQQSFLQHNLCTFSEKKLTIVHPGHWNHQGGPDFLGAEVIIDNQILKGDIEIHFYQNDWFYHNHHINPRFANVILHVPLFPFKNLHPQPFTLNGFCPEVFILFNHLYQGIEDYSLENALLNFEKKDLINIFDAFLALPAQEKKATLFHKARIRWQQKLAFLHNRLQRHSYEECCHQLCLEILGLHKNRIPMATISLEFPYKTWIQNAHKMNALELFSTQKTSWKLSGIRPNNHPLKRLQQYITLIQSNPNWAAHWINYIQKMPILEFIDHTSIFRKHFQLSSFVNYVQKTIFCNAISSTRLLTLCIDALLPLSSAYLKKDFFPLWYHFQAGDFPESIQTFLNKTEILTAKQPLCNGLVQAALQLFFESKP